MQFVLGLSQMEFKLNFWVIASDYMKFSLVIKLSMWALIWRLNGNCMCFWSVLFYVCESCKTQLGHYSVGTHLRWYFCGYIKKYVKVKSK